MKWTDFAEAREGGLAGGTHVGCRHDWHDRGAPCSARGTGTCAAARAAREPAAGLVRPGSGTILDAIGSTPLIIVDGIWVKLEYLDPSGSDRGAHRQVMINGRSGKGCCDRVDTIVEASGGIPGTR